METVNLNQNVSYSFIIDDRGASRAERKRQQSVTAPTSDGTSVSEVAKKLKQIKRSAPFHFAYHVIDTLVTAEINRVELRTGLSTLQQQIQWKKQTGVRIGGSLLAIAGGIATQNYIAAVGGVISLVNMGINYAVAEEDLNIKRQVERISIGQANIRAGALGGRNYAAAY